MSEKNEKKTRYKRGENPNSRKNLKLFSSEHQPATNGHPGGRNRSTILCEILNTSAVLKNPITKQEERMSVEKAGDLAIVGKMLQGDVSAWREVKDSVYGKIADKLESEGVHKIEIEFVNEPRKND